MQIQTQFKSKKGPQEIMLFKHLNLQVEKFRPREGMWQPNLQRSQQRNKVMSDTTGLKASPCTTDASYTTKHSGPTSAIKLEWYLYFDH